MRQKVSPWPVRVLVSVLTDFNYFYKYVPNTMFLFCLFDLGCKRRKHEQVKLAQVCVEFSSPFQKPKKYPQLK